MSLRNLWQRPRRDVFLLCEAILVVGCTQALLPVLHFQRLRRIAGRVSRALRWCTPHSVPVDALIWAILAAKTRLPMRTTCFGEALAAEALFRRHGYHPELRLGAKRLEGTFQAHAWLEWNHTVVIGGPAPVTAQYKPFPQIEC